MGSLFLSVERNSFLTFIMRSTITPILCSVAMFLLIACKNTYHKQITTLDLHEAAAGLITNYPDNKDSLVKAVSLFDQAIAMDKEDELAYASKAKALCRLGNCEETLEILNILVEMSRNPLAHQPMKGFLLERLGKKEEAAHVYAEIKKQEDSMYALYPDSTKIALGRASIILFTPGKDTALSELIRTMAGFPNDPRVLDMKGYIDSFDRAEFIESICK
jgi:tetratricopeptide (TPR) repeat protein